MNETSAESGEMRHSHLDLPLVTYPVIAEPIHMLIKNLSTAARLTLASGVAEIHVFGQLSRMCRTLVKSITLFFLEHLQRQISTYAHQHFPSDNKSIFTDTYIQTNSQPLLDGCSYCRVTEDDVHTSLGNIFDTCFGQILGTVQRQSSDSIMLRTLLSEKLTKEVNSILRNINGSTSVKLRRSTSPSKLEEIVYHVINILGYCFKVEHATQKAQSSQAGDAESPGTRKTACPLPQLPKCSIDETFLTLCLVKFIDHIADKTHTSIANLNFHQIVTRVKERLVEEQSYTVPRSVKNLHITIYKELCYKFRSKYVLQSVMEQGDAAFVEAFVETLKAQLKKSTEKTSKSKKKRSFRRNNKDHRVCKNKAIESHIDENENKNVRERNRQGGITRTCSFIFSGLRKAFA